VKEVEEEEVGEGTPIIQLYLSNNPTIISNRSSTIHPPHPFPLDLLNDLDPPPHYQRPLLSSETPNMTTTLTLSPPPLPPLPSPASRPTIPIQTRIWIPSRMPSRLDSLLRRLLLLLPLTTPTAWRASKAQVEERKEEEEVGRVRTFCRQRAVGWAMGVDSFMIRRRCLVLLYVFSIPTKHSSQRYSQSLRPQSPYYSGGFIFSFVLVPFSALNPLDPPNSQTAPSTLPSSPTLLLSLLDPTRPPPEPPPNGRPAHRLGPLAGHPVPVLKRLSGGRGGKGRGGGGDEEEGRRGAGDGAGGEGQGWRGRGGGGWSGCWPGFG
jgi:hypothetical protein